MKSAFEAARVSLSGFPWRANGMMAAGRRERGH